MTQWDPAFSLGASTVPHRQMGAPIPLFDRLIETGEEDTIPGHLVKTFYTKEELIASIERDVNRILSTRSGVRQEEFVQLSKKKENFSLPQMFGLPDFSQQDIANNSHWPKLERLCILAIEHFEPRLKKVQVRIQRFDTQAQCILGQIKASLNVHPFQEEVLFPMALDPAHLST